MPYTMRVGDAGIVSNLRSQFGEALQPYADATVAGAWVHYSQSEDYDTRNTEPSLFIEWVKMKHED